MPITNHDRERARHGRGGERPLRTRSVERRDSASRELLVQRVAAEFREMPCLRVTAEQAERLFGLRADVSTRIISRLVQQGVVRIDEDGRYAAASAG